jgi:hypothetical protein
VVQTFVARPGRQWCVCFSFVLGQLVRIVCVIVEYILLAEAMADLTCTGAEWSIEECSWAAPDEACSAHSQDTVVYCAKSDAAVPQGAARLIAADGSPSIDGKGRPEIFMEGAWVPICSSGVGPGAAAVICKSMGFSGAGAGGASACSGGLCGDAAPGLSELACTGSESDVLSCPHEAGDDVFCAPSESVVVTCAGDGETQGRPAKEAAPQPMLGGAAALAPTHNR